MYRLRSAFASNGIAVEVSHDMVIPRRFIAHDERGSFSGHSITLWDRKMSAQEHSGQWVYFAECVPCMTGQFLSLHLRPGCLFFFLAREDRPDW